MDTFQTSSQTSVIDKFKLGKNGFGSGLSFPRLILLPVWFTALLSFIEKDHRKGGIDCYGLGDYLGVDRIFCHWPLFN